MAKIQIFIPKCLRGVGGAGLGIIPKKTAFLAASLSIESLKTKKYIFPIDRGIDIFETKLKRNDKEVAKSLQSKQSKIYLTSLHLKLRDGSRYQNG